ncbi:Iron only hydrogenase large subunit [Fragilaria crotonensis]|nr:Iron only hydrogenase large subunit [Fragilaria crotonensis]
MSSVFLSNVDDYLGPSQACVNPLFAESVNTKQDNAIDMPSKEVAVVVPRTRTIRRKRKPSDIVGIPTAPTETAKVTMADCLACSGCVTSAETVLVEQHSLKTLREKLATLELSSPHTAPSIVFTVSPASWADVLRHLDLPEATISRRKLATLLHQTCRASVVLDGQVPLHWSLQEAAREFCHAYNRGRVTTAPPPASIALSATQSQLLHDGTIVTHTARSESHLPLVSSSCPAVVCLVEKSYPNHVPHLATTKSPMALAGSYFTSQEHNLTGVKQFWHVGIMPCHDKKLEASRRDFTVNDQPDVDLVITTSEWIDLIRETCNSSDVKVMREYVESLEPAPSVTSLGTDGCEDSSVVVLVEVGSDDSFNTQTFNEDDFFAHSSGGYADFIFRFAAKNLFGFNVEGQLPWSPVEKRGKMSARVAASRKKDYHAVTLYRLSDGSYSMQRPVVDDAVPVLRFATAYGFQTLQRILQPMDKNELEYDYIEAMACPSGCLNGGGQVRLADRESPKETRQRVAETQARCSVLSCLDVNAMNMDVYSKSCPSGPFGPEAQLQLHTRFHVVPPLQHSLGAAAGVAVQDTQW